MEHQSENSTAARGLTFAEKLNKRIQILTNFFFKDNILCDRIRNIGEIAIANEGDFEVRIDMNFRKILLEGERNQLRRETMEKLRELRKPTLY